MSFTRHWSVSQKALVAVVTILAPVVTFLLLGGTETADVGAVGWILVVVGPLALLGVGLFLLAEGTSRLGGEDDPT